MLHGFPTCKWARIINATTAAQRFFGFRAQIDLPVINNGDPLLRQREAEHCQRAVTAQQLATRARIEAEAAADRYERARLLATNRVDVLPTELPVEFRFRQLQRSRSAVGAVVVVIAQMTLVEQSGDLFRREPLARLDG